MNKHEQFLDELLKPVPKDFYDGGWYEGTYLNEEECTEQEKKFLEALSYFLPRHMEFYDWNRPYAEAILKLVRYHITNQEPLMVTKSNWSQEFDKQFVDENLWKSQNEDTAFVPIGNIKKFIEELVESLSKSSNL